MRRISRLMPDRASNHVRNGFILTKEFHALFDKGLVTVEPPSAARPGDYRVPEDPRLRPSTKALEWHRDVVSERVA